MNENIILDNQQSTEIDTNDNLSSETNIEISSVPLEEIYNTNIVYEYPEYTTDNPMPVYIVDEIINETSTLALSDVYYGTISDTYLNYFEGIVEKLPHDSHYLVWRSGAYSYSMAYGKNLEMTENVVHGECEVVQIFRDSEYNSNWYVSNLSDNIEIETTSLFAYSDLGNLPTLERGIDTVTSNTILFAIGVAFVYLILRDIFDNVQHLFDRKEK